MRGRLPRFPAFAIAFVFKLRGQKVESVLGQGTPPARWPRFPRVPSKTRNSHPQLSRHSVEDAQLVAINFRPFRRRRATRFCSLSRRESAGVRATRRVDFLALRRRRATRDHQISRHFDEDAQLASAPSPIGRGLGGLGVRAVRTASGLQLPRRRATRRVDFLAFPRRRATRDHQFPAFRRRRATRCVDFPPFRRRRVTPSFILWWQRRTPLGR